MPDGPTPVLHARGLTRTYELGGETVTALDAVDLDLAAHERLAVTGVSGSGKSTLLHLCGGLDRPDAGTLRALDHDLLALDEPARALFRRRHIGFVFQAFHLVKSRTALANVELALTLQGTFGHERRERAVDALQRVGLGARLHHRPAQLSGGEQQRVAVARALVKSPRLLLADEPTGNLDRRTAHVVMELLCAVTDEAGATLLFVTHDHELAARHATRTVAMCDGRLATAEVPA